MKKTIKITSFVILLIITISCEEENTKNSDIQFDYETGTLMDIEGNSYKTVKIGDQWWLAENLRVTKYNDGSNISNITGDSEWINDTNGAYCWFNNDKASHFETYGALYNWYAVNSKKLCPPGWHVPTYDDWKTLEKFLIANGYNYDGSTKDNKIAKSLSATIDWKVTSTEGAVGNSDYPEYRNKSGFSALPGSYRSMTYGEPIGLGGHWWSSSKGYYSNAAKSFSIDYYESAIDYGESILYKGYSVRCVKNVEPN